MKIHICYNFVAGPWGGGNQFLNAIKKELARLDLYEDDSDKADVILFNTNPMNIEAKFAEIVRLKEKHYRKIVVNRIDGPVSHVRGGDRQIDKIIARFTNLLADGIIFQSKWCKEQNKEYFRITSRYETVIYNAADSDVFYRNNRDIPEEGKKIKLIASSWSPNWRKGFDVYRFLDANLDFSKYEMSFVGNSPIQFQRIRQIEAVPSVRLAKLLREHDIFITASRNDPCSNVLIEALSCGLPSVVCSDGGHPELIGQGGKVFNDKTDILSVIDSVAMNYRTYRENIPEYSIKNTAEDYYRFSKKIFDDVNEKKYLPACIDVCVRWRLYILELLIYKRRALRNLWAFYNIISRK